MMHQRLFLLDAYALIYRAYYAMIRSPRITSKEFNTSAIFGFVNTLNEVLNKEQPTHIAVCFDPAGPTFRHEAYEDYKAQREKQPEDITLSVPWIKEILQAMHIPVVEVPGYEADDVIGTLSAIAEREGFDTYMMTPDKDYGQLVTDHVKMYRPSLRGEGFEIRGPEEVCARYGIERPSQVIDLLALEGDTSDNIPGCPGIGEKTAAKLIQAYGSVENLIANSGQLTGATRKRVEDNKEQIEFSKFLATIKTDVPLPEDITPQAMTRSEPDYQTLAEIYRKLEFRTFIKRMESAGQLAAPHPAEPAADGFVGSLFDEPAEQSASNLTTTPHNYTCITDNKTLQTAVDEALTNISPIGITVYAPGESAMSAPWLGIAVSPAEGKAFYAVVPAENTDKATRKEFFGLISRLAASPATIISHDVKRAMIVLRRHGIRLTDNYYDTSLAHYLIDPETTHRIAGLAFRYLKYNMAEQPDDRTGLKRFQPIAPQEAATVMCEHADMTLRLYSLLNGEVENQGLMPLLNDIELPLVKVLAEMEYTGVRIDSDVLDDMSVRFTKRLDEMETEIFRLAGERFNLASPMQVGRILFEKLQIDSNGKRTKKGGYSTTEEILEKLRPTHAIVDLILRHRALKKLLTTYVNALPGMVNRHTGKIHTSYNQTVTATGRISSANPNLQNIPIRSDDGREIRSAFVADPGDIIMSADYSQIELRLIADLSGDPDMIEAFGSGEDIHRATAAKIYHVAPSDVSDTQRRNAKTANFGIIYGISAFGLSERLGIPRSEARDLIEGYFATYPRIRAYMEENVDGARRNGYVTTVMGRKRFLSEINSRNATVRNYAERNAVNAPIQGSAADIIKRAMVDIYHAIEEAGLKSRMIMQVHDELVFNVIPDELPQLQEIACRLMEQAYVGRVRLEVAAGSGRTWLEAH